MSSRTATLGRPPVAATLAGSAVVAIGLFALLRVVAGLGVAGWLGGGTFLVLAGALVARAAHRDGAATLGPAGSVTALRAVLTGGVAALVAQDLARPGTVPTAPLVVLAALALLLDGVDGQVARRTRTASELGARFDAELDAALLAVLSVSVATDLGAWVLLIGGMRYAFVAAGWALPWLRGSLPVRRSAKVVAALQGVVLVVASTELLPPVVATVLVAVALAALTWSFAVSVVWLARHRDEAVPARVPDDEEVVPDDTPPTPTWRRVTGVVVTALAVVVLALVLVAPQDTTGLVPEAYLRLPLEGIAGLALLLLLPARVRRPLALVAGALLGVWAVLSAFDVGFATVLARPFDPVLDRALVADGAEFVGSTYGTAAEVGAVVVVVVLGVVLLAGGALAARRVVTRAAAHRRPVLRTLGALAAVWLVAIVTGTTTSPGVALAAANTPDALATRVRLTDASLRDAGQFASQSRADAWAGTPAPDLLTALRGKDVVVAVVESYGRAALADPGLAATVTPVLDRADRDLPAAGWGVRSGFLTSSVVGSGSWLAHATFLSGLHVDNEQRYLTLTSSSRFTLSQAFRRAGWDTSAMQPGTTRPWPEGAFYGYDRAYNVTQLGYRGPSFGWASMPDQFVLQRYDQLERDRPAPRAPIMSEIDLVSSHAPWAPLPHMVGWDQLGDGSVFWSQTANPGPRDTAAVRAGYATSIAYTMDALTSWVQRSNDPNLVVIAFGDHQPAPLVTGPGAGADVPISIISRDPAVLARTDPWGWTPGLKPAPTAPTWPMEAFRDRFLQAFSPR
ncbi:CDP-alcohol phosphatidyltransferase family protein [Actinomycetospora sp. TBRC 11914]|uniref:CDP-alcohol phosphatidyltransferase family protein n=1 Tax=Actinomycetospora sp. TBRC 11914 TaxID=2729387 RepID=UPI0020BDA3B6|nr:CDP-alcohol phosphatidyltransferase family protein [Actinomycetospora sp. TBRC 11914]